MERLAQTDESEESKEQNQDFAAVYSSTPGMVYLVATIANTIISLRRENHRASLIDQVCQWGTVLLCALWLLALYATSRLSTLQAFEDMRLPGARQNHAFVPKLAVLIKLPLEHRRFFQPVMKMAYLVLPMYMVLIIMWQCHYAEAGLATLTSGKDVPYEFVIAVGCVGSACASTAVIPLWAGMTSTWHTSMANVDNLVAYLGSDHPVDWKKAYSDFDRLASKLNALWGNVWVGIPWLASLVLGAAGLLTWVIVLTVNEEAEPPTSYSPVDLLGQLGLVCFCATACVMPLYALSNITTFVCGQKQSVQSVFVVTLRAAARFQLNDADSLSHMRLLHYIESKAVGASLCDMIISADTYQAVCWKVFIQIPVLYGVVRALVKQHVHVEVS